MELQLLSKKQEANKLWAKENLYVAQECFISYSGRTLNLGKVILALSIHKQFGTTEIDWQMKASDAEEPEILQVAYGYRDWRISVLYHSLSSSSEMVPNTGQTRLDISTVVSLVTEEPEGLALGTGGGERPSEQSLAYRAGRLSVAGMAACSCKENLFKEVELLIVIE